jgi:hypothetical protein
MARRTVIVVWLIALALAPFHLAEAQQPKKIPRIGFLIAGASCSGANERLDAFRQGLNALGYVEGKNFIINLKTTKQIGLTIPPEALARATKLIK